MRGIFDIMCACMDGNNKPHLPLKAVALVYSSWRLSFACSVPCYQLPFIIWERKKVYRTWVCICAWGCINLEREKEWRIGRWRDRDIQMNRWGPHAFKSPWPHFIAPPPPLLTRSWWKNASLVPAYRLMSFDESCTVAMDNVDIEVYEWYMCLVIHYTLYVWVEKERKWPSQICRCFGLQLLFMQLHNPILNLPLLTCSACSFSISCGSSCPFERRERSLRMYNFFLS